MRKKIIAIVIVMILILGIAIGMNAASTIQENRMKVYAYELENANTDIVSYFDGIENALFPMHKNTKITQTAFEQYSHSGKDNRRNRYYESNAMDICNGSDIYMYAPFTGRVVDFYSSCNCFAFQSENKVRYANGDYDYMTVYFLHSAQYNQIQHYLNSGELISQGTRMVAQGGSDGKNNKAYGEHLDVQVRKGKNPGIDSDVKLNGNTFAYDAFFKGNETTFADYNKRTSISNGQYPQYVGEWKEDKYNGAWASSQEDVFLPIDSSSRSILKVSCDSDIAFVQEYNLFDLLSGKVVNEELENIVTIRNVVDNYITLDYTGLSDFEKKVYDACNTEWVDSIPDNNPSERETKDKTLIITFNPGDNAFCDELSREITWGTCTHPFPTPYKPGDTFIAWLDDNNEEVTCDSLIANDIILHAKWMNDSTAIMTTAPPVTTPPEETVTIIVEAEVYSEPNVVQTEPTNNAEMTNPVPERTPIMVDSVVLNRYSKTLNTVGNSVSFSLSAEAYPSNAEGRTIRFESSNPAVAKVDCNTGYVSAVSDGSCRIVAVAENGVSASCEVVVSTQYTTRTEIVPITSSENVPESYNMECYCGRLIANKMRQFYNYDFSGSYDTLGLSEQYGMWHHEYTFPASEVDAAPRIYRGQQQGGSQNGQNACDAVGFSMWYGDAPYIFFIKSVNYKTVETTTYETKSTLVPVEYN